MIRLLVWAVMIWEPSGMGGMASDLSGGTIKMGGVTVDQGGDDMSDNEVGGISDNQLGGWCCKWVAL